MRLSVDCIPAGLRKVAGGTAGTSLHFGSLSASDRTIQVPIINVICVCTICCFFVAHVIWFIERWQVGAWDEYGGGASRRWLGAWGRCVGGGGR